MEVPVPSYQSQAAMLSCTGCVFKANHASAGACIYWTGQELEPICTDCLYDWSNSALYGSWNATPALSCAAQVVSDATNTSSAQVSVQLSDWYNQSVVLLPAPSASVVSGGTGSGLLSTAKLLST
eukprot:TRINITY_DN6461_c0_g1_i2.p1 TRINITY_DN6461_c0_g1~~TRINITY_DN6461_c0_g1_i2.p1  ORF type:complete len:146 (-),score=33.53 TRINITY_DN6461_c0_g1_i2:406-780(-)